MPLFPLLPPRGSCQSCRVKEPPPTEKLPINAPGKVKLRSGGIPANVRPIEYHPHAAATPPVAVQKSTAIRAGWILLLVGLFLACIPILGFVSWLIGYPLCFAALILGCLGAANGRPLAGVALIVASITAAPVALFVAPFVSTAIAAAASGPASPAPAEIKEDSDDAGIHPVENVEVDPSGTWTDLDGRKMHAKLLDVKRDENRKLVARFEKEDGKIYSFPVDELVPEDRNRALEKLNKD